MYEWLVLSLLMHRPPHAYRLAPAHRDRGRLELDRAPRGAAAGHGPVTGCVIAALNARRSTLSGDRTRRNAARNDCGTMTPYNATKVSGKALVNLPSRGRSL